MSLVHKTKVKKFVIMKRTTILLPCICAVFQLIKGESVECPSEGIAYIPHSKCTQFHICLDGETAELTCPFGLYYNPETIQCDFPENVDGCRGGTRPPFSSTTTTEMPPSEMTECGQSIIADNGTIRYKLNEPYDAGELCVFLIKFESGKVGSTFTLDSHGFTPSDSDAVTIVRTLPIPGFAANLGISQPHVAFEGYGAVVIFRTNSSLGTGFQLSFKRNGLPVEYPVLGTYLAFDDERDSPLNISSSTTGETMHNYFVFTSGSKFISEPETIFGLAVKGWFGNEENICTASNGFWVYSFVNELMFARQICRKIDDDKVFEYISRGLYLVFQLQYNNKPLTRGVITWNEIPTP